MEAVGDDGGDSVGDEDNDDTLLSVTDEDTDDTYRKLIPDSRKAAALSKEKYDHRTDDNNVTDFVNSTSGTEQKKT